MFECLKTLFIWIGFSFILWYTFYGDDYMEIKIGYLYHIKDEFFDAVNDENIMANHERGKNDLHILQ